MNTFCYAVLAVSIALCATLAQADGPPSVKQECTVCHKRGFSKEDPKLVSSLSELCLKCHPDRLEVDHPVDIIPSMPVEGLPLDDEGRMTCTTCHSPHGRTGMPAMLRDWPVKICNRCHDK